MDSGRGAMSRAVSDPVESADRWGIHIGRKVCESAVCRITVTVGKMPGPLSQDLRDRLTAAVAAGSSARAAAERFGVSESTAIRSGGVPRVRRAPDQWVVTIARA